MEELQQTPQTPVSTTVPTIIYILYLLNIMVPFTGLIAVIMAYVNKGENNFLQSHYQFQIRTFWIGLLFGLIGALLTMIVIGWVLILLFIIWLIVRCVVGLKYLGKQQEIPDPTSWGFGN